MPRTLRAARMAGVLLLLGAAFTAPADASIRVGSSIVDPADTTRPCPSGAPACSAVVMATSFGRSARVPVDGVIVRWWMAAPSATGSATFQVVRERIEGYRAVVSETYPVTLTGVPNFPTRVPVRAGDLLGLQRTGAPLPWHAVTGASSWAFAPPLGSAEVNPTAAETGVELLVGATVEPDRDRDGFGDETQDQCPEDRDRQGACSGTLVGPSLTGSWQTSAGGVPGDTVANARPLPADGVLVRWRFRSSLGTAWPRILRPAGGGTYRAVARGDAYEGAGVGEPRIHVAPTRLRVRRGDLLGLGFDAQSSVVLEGTPGQTALHWSAPGLDNGPAAPSTTFNTSTLAINGDVEPDADRDGYGDETQDACPTDGTRQAACAAAPAPAPVPSPAPPGPSGSPAPVTPQQVTPPLTRFGAARAAASTIRWRGGTTVAVPLTCPAGTAGCRGTVELRLRTTRLGRATFRLRSGQRRSVTIRLPARARRTLRRARRARTRTTLVVTPAGPAPTRRSLTLVRTR